MSTQPIEIDAVEREIYIAARPEIVYAYFTDPRRMLAWKGIEAVLDPRPGGLYRVRINEDTVIRGAFVELLPPRRVVFTWGWEGEGHPVPPGSTTVEVTIAPEGAGSRLRLRHAGLSAPFRQQHHAGWQHYLDRLAIAAAGGEPGPDAHAGVAGRPSPTASWLAERSSRMGSPVVHFEISSHSSPQLHEFYSGVFDWQIDANNDMQYGLVNTGVEGNLGGGIGPTHDGQNHVTFYIQVPDLAATLAQIEAKGGKTLMPPMAVPGGPTIARFADPAGNDIGLIQG